MQHSRLYSHILGAIFALDSFDLETLAPESRGKSVLALSTGTTGEAELLIYGPIGDYFWGDGVTAASIVEQLSNLSAATINVRINSDGGVVNDGLAIYNALDSHPATINVTIDGIAASIASLIAQAGKTRRMYGNSMLMIHGPMGGAFGFSGDLRDRADVLDTYAKAMKNTYGARGKDGAAIGTMLSDRKDHWFTADEAVAAGFADEIVSEEKAVPNDAAAAAALLSYVQAISTTPANVTATLRRRIQTTTTASAFASLRAGHQRAVYAHLQESTMKQHCQMILAQAGNNSPAAPSVPAPVVASDDVLAQLQARNQRIRELFSGFHDIPGIRDLETACLADPRMTIEQAQGRLLSRMGNGATPLAGASVPSFHASASGGEPAGSDFVLAASDALAAQIGIHVENPHPGARDVQGMGLQGIIRACVQRAGDSRGTRSGAERADLVRAALSTSDFPAILENTLRKALRAGYAVEPATYEAWSRRILVPDFKPQTRVILGSAPDLDLVPEGGEYSYGSLDEDKSLPYKVDKYGKLIKLTWEALINDDLGAFSRIVQAMGQAAARKEGDHVYASFGENSGAGPTMQDGASLFHASHGNLASSSTALDADALGKGRILLRRQTAVGGGVLNLTPRFLLVAPEHEQAAETLLAASARALSQGSDNALVPAWLSKLELAVEARLTAAAAYLLTSPEQVDTLERAWLEADNGPLLEEEPSFNVDARTYKVRHVFGARWLDWRGVVKLPIG